MHQNSGWENYIYVPAFMAASHLNPFVLISSQSSYFKKKTKMGEIIYISLYLIFVLDIAVRQQISINSRDGVQKGKPQFG